MNKDQVKGAARKTAGKIQRKAGTAASSRKHEIKGGTRELAGKVQRAYGDAREDAEKSRERNQGRA
ncbi:MAG TPA: CsbD family protein [Steroidobacteraceae bacterium]|nr:CsbD family protein [Steroidobacteraceae bacterium]